jgi:hypothetical protein
MRDTAPLRVIDLDFAEHKESACIDHARPCQQIARLRPHRPKIADSNGQRRGIHPRRKRRSGNIEQCGLLQWRRIQRSRLCLKNASSRHGPRA